MNSPQSQNDAVGSIVDRYVAEEMTSTATATIQFHLLNVFLSITHKGNKKEIPGQAGNDEKGSPGFFRVNKMPGPDHSVMPGPDRASLSLAQVLAMDGAGPHDERRKDPHWLVQVLKCYRNLRRVSVIYAF